MFRENVAQEEQEQEQEQVTFSVCFCEYYVDEELRKVFMEGPVPFTKIGTPTLTPCLLVSTFSLSLFTGAPCILWFIEVTHQQIAIFSLY